MDAEKPETIGAEPKLPSIAVPELPLESITSLFLDFCWLSMIEAIKSPSSAWTQSSLEHISAESKKTRLAVSVYTYNL